MTLGIDLGITNSLAAFWRDGKAVIVPNAVIVTWLRDFERVLERQDPRDAESKRACLEELLNRFEIESRL